MSVVTYIEQICEKEEIKLPALAQLRAAQKKNDKESINRISNNIINYLKNERKIIISETSTSK